MKDRRNWLIIYDISDKKRLARVARILTKYAVRVQHSIYEMSIDDYKMKVIRKQIISEIDCTCDSVVWYDLCEDDWFKRKKFGPGSEKGQTLGEYLII